MTYQTQGWGFEGTDLSSHKTNRSTMRQGFALLLAILGIGHAFVTHKARPRAFGMRFQASTAPVDPANVRILANADAVGAEIRSILETAAQTALAERGHFCLAIPGGSILKMLIGSGGDWTASTTLAYVNHKCVAMDNEQLATHAKALELFLKDWQGTTTILLGGTDLGEEEAAGYEAKLRALPDHILPKQNGLPVFDLALIGVGDDGHIGSLYPGRDEVLSDADGPWVLPVDIKSPPSITLSLPVMVAAKQVVVAACGVSDKYPQGKSSGMRRAIAAEDETIQTFPAVGLRDVAEWVLDEAAASQLGPAYSSAVTFD